MPAKKGAATKRLNNNPGKREIEAVKPPPGVPEMPNWLCGEAAAEWGRIIPILDAMGVLSLLDRAVIADYCTVWSQLVRVERELSGADVLTETRSDSEGMVKNPLWSVANQLRQRFDRKCEMLGLAPGPRGRLDVPEKPVDDDALGILD
jgi:P27 family predicted phage terminase small subunit